MSRTDFISVCPESVVTHGTLVGCSGHVGHPMRKLTVWRWHEGPGGVRWPAEPAFSFTENGGPRWQGPESGFDMIGRLDEPLIPGGPNVRAMLLATALCAGADLDGTPESWGVAAAMRARFETGTPRLSYDEALAFADLARLHAVPDHRETVLRAIGYLSAVNGIPRTTCRGLNGNGDRCGRSDHHRGECRH